MRVLIVEDEPLLAGAIRDGLRLERSRPTSPATVTPLWSCRGVPERHAILILTAADRLGLIAAQTARPTASVSAWS